MTAVLKAAANRMSPSNWEKSAKKMKGKKHVQKLGESVT
jgi:hypothetical protein